MALVSFVIPAYNASSTIIRCLESIYSLPIDEPFFEVIVVDDCSTDATVDLIKEYSVNHSNLILLCQEENHRQGAARNRGMAVAKGKYIVFVDSDDETAEGVALAIQMAEEKELDMVAMRYVKVSDTGTIVKEVGLSYNRNSVFTGVQMQVDHPFWSTAPWPYIYRKSFLEKVDYPFVEDMLFEDSDFVAVHLFQAKRMAYCDESGYLSHYNVNSTTQTLSYKHLADYALLGTRMLHFYETFENKTSSDAKLILEGGSFNIMKAFKKLPRLKSYSEVRAFYDRLDGYYDRKKLYGFREPSYCWTRWTRFCIKYRGMAIAIIGAAIPLIRIRVKN